MILRIEKLESSLGVARAGILARNKVIEMDRASMVLQDLHLLKQQEALNAKPGEEEIKKPKNERKRAGKTPHLTRIHRGKKEICHGEEEGEEEKVQRKKDRGMKKTAKEESRNRVEDVLCKVQASRCQLARSMPGPPEIPPSPKAYTSPEDRFHRQGSPGRDASYPGRTG